MNQEARTLVKAIILLLFLVVEWPITWHILKTLPFQCIGDHRCLPRFLLHSTALISSVPLCFQENQPLIQIAEGKCVHVAFYGYSLFTAQCICTGPVSKTAVLI